MQLLQGYLTLYHVHARNIALLLGALVKKLDYHGPPYCKACRGVDCENAIPEAPISRAIDDSNDVDYEDEIYDVYQDDDNE